MVQFYTVLLFIGVLMSFFQLVYLTAGKRSLSKSMKILNEKQDELENILNDAELMVEELNKISDYVVQQVDTKSGELQNVVSVANDRIKYLENIKEIQKESETAKSGVEKMFVNYSSVKPDAVKSKNTTVKNDKIISFGAKHAQVLNMSHNGLNDSEIAKNLKIGKGEIELIRGMDKVAGSAHDIPFN